MDISADDDDDACDNDIQVIKVVESHSSEIERSGNTSKYFGPFLHKLTSYRQYWVPFIGHDLC